MVWARNGRTEILATSPIATIRIVDEESQSGGGVLRTGLTIVWIVVFSNGVLFYLARRVFGRSGIWEGPVLQPAVVLAVGTAVALVVLDGERRSGERLRPVPIAPLVASFGLGVWAVASTAWSVEPRATLWRGIVYAFLPCVAWVIADLSFAAFRRALALAAGVLVLGGLAVVLLDGAAAVDANGDWKGLMTNRNGFAPLCGLAVIVGLSLLAERRRAPAGTLLVAGVIGLLGAGSRTSFVALTSAVAVIGAVAAWHRFGGARPLRSLSAAVAVVAAGAVLLPVGLDLWNTPTLARRRALWRIVGDQVADAPVLGRGWEAFWRWSELPDEALLRSGSAHGSIPELLLGGGVIALGLWVVVVGHTLIGTLHRATTVGDQESRLWLAVTVFLLVHNITESFVLWFSYNWILLIAGALRFGGPGRVPAPGRRSMAVAADGPDRLASGRVGGDR